MENRIIENNPNIYRKEPKVEKLIDSYIKINHITPKKATNLRLFRMFVRDGIICFNYEADYHIDRHHCEVSAWIESTKEVQGFLTFLKNLLGGFYPNQDVKEILSKRLFEKDDK